MSKKQPKEWEVRLQKGLSAFADKKDLETFLTSVRVKPYKRNIGERVWVMSVAPRFGIYNVFGGEVVARKRIITDRRISENVYEVIYGGKIFCGITEDEMFSTESNARIALVVFKDNYKYKTIGGKK